MGLGILEDKHLAHVPGEFHPISIDLMLIASLGTASILDQGIAGDDVQADSVLKYDRSGPVPIILVPQPSDDPNDPLVFPPCSTAKSPLLTSTELAAVEARPHPNRPFPHGRFVCNHELHHGCEHCDHFTLLREELYFHCASHWLSSVWSRRGGCVDRAYCSRMGQAPSFFAWEYFDDSQLCLGRCKQR